jgi:hypothetical protein
MSLKKFFRDFSRTSAKNIYTTEYEVKKLNRPHSSVATADLKGRQRRLFPDAAIDEIQIRRPAVTRDE